MSLGVSATVALARSWWAFIVRGVAAIVFGILAFISPGTTVVVLVALFAAWALVDGVVGIWTGIRTRRADRSWWLQVLEGVVSVVAGVVALVLPDLAADVLVLLIGAWAIVTGAVQIWSAIRLREQISGEVWLGLAGVASILFGIVLILFPAAGVLSLVWLIGSAAIVFGIFLAILGWRLRRIDELGRLDAAHDYRR